VRDEGTGTLVTIGKAYNGLTDAEIREMTERLIALTVEDRGHYRTVRRDRPRGGLQPSPALGAPRVRVRLSASRGSSACARIAPGRREHLADVERLAATLAPAPPGTDGGGEAP
jgi:hypothetical protein